MLQDFVKDKSYLSQLFTTSYKRSNHSEFYSNGIKNNLYHTASFTKQQSEIALLRLESELVNRIFDNWDYTFPSSPISLMFSKEDMTLLGGFKITSIFEGYNQFARLCIPFTKENISMNTTAQEPIMIVQHLKNARIHTKCQIVQVSQKLWMIIGGVLEGQWTNDIILVKYLRKKHSLIVGQVVYQGSLPIRKNFACVNANGKIFFHGGEQNNSIFGDFYIINIRKIGTFTGNFSMNYEITVTEVITAGLPSAISGHGLSYTENFIYAFGGKNNINPNIIIRKLSLETMIWQEVEKIQTFPEISKFYGEISVMKFGPVMIAHAKNSNFDVVFDSHLNIASVILNENQCDTYRNHIGMYGFEASDSRVHTCRLFAHDYYNIKPIGYSAWSIGKLLEKTINSQVLSNLTIRTSSGIILVNLCVIALRGSESKNLLMTMKNSEIDLTRYPLPLITEIITYLYTDQFEFSSRLSEVLGFAKNYYMNNLILLCNITMAGTNLKNSSINLYSDLGFLHSFCSSTSLLQNSSIDPGFYDYIKTDFFIVSDTNYPCHKYFLYLHSGFIRNLLAYSPEVESVSLEEFSGEAVKTMIKYCYMDIEIENSLLGELMGLARYLDMKGLFFMCQEKLSKIITPANLLMIYELSVRLQAETLMKFIKEYVEIFEFKGLKNCEIPLELVEELKIIRRKGKLMKKAAKKPEFVLDIEGETQEVKLNRLLSIFPLPSENDPVPSGLHEIPVIDYNTSPMLHDLDSASQRGLKIIKNLVFESESEEEDFDIPSVANRFKCLEDD